MTATALLVASTVWADEPLELTDDQLDRVTAGAVTQVVVFTPNQPPQQVGCECLNLFAEHPDASPDVFVYVVPGQNTLTKIRGRTTRFPKLAFEVVRRLGPSFGGPFLLLELLPDGVALGGTGRD
jgi:hypothetical protein